MAPRAGPGASKASNGEEALHILKGGSKPDIIIANLNTAAMNGIQLIREISRFPGYRFTLPKLVAASSGSLYLERRGQRIWALEKRPQTRSVERL